MDALAEALYEAQNFPAVPTYRLDARLREQKAAFLDPMAKKPAGTATVEQIVTFYKEANARISMVARLFAFRQTMNVDEPSAVDLCIFYFTNELLADENFSTRMLTAISVRLIHCFRLYLCVFSGSVRLYQGSLDGPSASTP